MPLTGKSANRVINAEAASLRWCALKGVLLVAGVTPLCAAAAEMEYTPSVAVGVVADDNVFYDAAGESDVIGRVSPALEFNYDTAVTRFNGYYTFDAEYYADNSDLSSAAVRQDLRMELDHSLSERLRGGFEAWHSRTEIPGELNVLSEAQEGRDEAYRSGFAPWISWDYASRRSIGADFQVTHDNLDDGAEALVSEVTLEHTWKPTRTRRLSMGYGVAGYEFDPGTDRTTQYLFAGWREDLSRRTYLDIEGGPRFTENGEDDVDFTFDGVLRHNFQQSFIEGRFYRRESTLIGEEEAIEVTGISLGTGWRMTNALSLAADIGFNDLSTISDDDDAQVFRMRLQAHYPWNESTEIVGSWEHLQQTDGVAFGPDIERNAIYLSVIFTFSERPRDHLGAERRYLSPSMITTRRLAPGLGNR